MNGMNKQSMKSRLGGVLVAQRLERRTFDQAVVGSIPGRVIIRGTRSTQPSIPPGKVNCVPALLTG